MSRVALRQIIGRQPEASLLVATIAEALGAVVTVEDTDGRLLHGAVSDAASEWQAHAGQAAAVMTDRRCAGFAAQRRLAHIANAGSARARPM